MSEKDTELTPQNYWKENVRLLSILLVIWFVVSYGFGILLVDVLNNIRLFGFQLGFWFAQQGSIYVFLALIIIYVRGMAKLDEKYNVGEDKPVKAAKK
ncbi:putative solute symporter protein [Desulfurispirillum indicum S5]|uniref:Putative solute symporter protein n=1 Tax=Desulfurispirillum indicum (strain ATCC BAA-1389 / DSM 22839 / S5) TaxID=653733 RepID=E6W414_DESIS|nr:DUF4212 domain-containing protein [Desulfurispirillum indicum]ADU66978.1 putative solute symporter protein [Desulfurispirillum indicum S5]